VRLIQLKDRVIVIDFRIQLVFRQFERSRCEGVRIVLEVGKLMKNEVLLDRALMDENTAGYVEKTLGQQSMRWYGVV
jgi:hypothetical protein